MPEDACNLVLIVPAQFNQRLRHKDETSRQSKGIGLGAFDSFNTESSRLVGDTGGKTIAYFIQHLVDLWFLPPAQLLPDFTCQVQADFIFDFDCVGFAAGYRLPHPHGLANFRPDLSAQIVE